MKLLGTSNMKTAKGEKLGYLTAILHLAPAKLSGFNVCPKASLQCAAACLNTAGMGAFSNVQDARIAKTLWYFNETENFMATLVKDVRSFVKRAAKVGLTPVIRLNGTSDIRWENEAVEGAENIMALFPDIQWYDYTKIANRKNIPANYHLTFSRSESNDADVKKAMANNFNVAVVFATKKGEDLPATYLGREVIDGDVSDVRFKDKKNVVVGLRAKGKARKDHGGFVVAV